MTEQFCRSAKRLLPCLTNGKAARSTCHLRSPQGVRTCSFGDPLNWWLVGDGTPSDGSWSFFLDSVRATLDEQEIKTKFDVVCIDQHARPDTWLPILGSEGTYSLVEQNEKGLILYASNKSVQDTQADAYFIFKQDDPVFAYSDSGTFTP